MSKNGELKGFEIAGADKQFYPARANILNGERIELWANGVAEPVAVRYGWANYPVVNIANSAGLPINILPIIMGATNLWLMRMTPKTGDSTQQRVMMFMPLIFLIFCYNFAAALALYYTTQNLFTILQLYQNRKQPLPALEKVAPAGKKLRKGRP